MGNLLTDSVVQQKITELKSVTQMDVVGIEYNTSSNTYTYDTLLSKCEAGLTNGATSKTLFIGESMGGYLAAQLAAKYGAYAHLTCPVVNVYKDVYVKVMHSSPSWSFAGGTVSMNEAQAKLFDTKQHNPLKLPATHIAVTVATNDTLLGYTDAVNYYQGHCSTLYVSDIIGHCSIANVNAWKSCQQIMFTALAS